jgi:hypothetical protein
VLLCNLLLKESLSKKDVIEIMKYFKKSADHGNVKGIFNYEALYENYLENKDN